MTDERQSDEDDLKKRLQWFSFLLRYEMPLESAVERWKTLWPLLTSWLEVTEQGSPDYRQHVHPLIEFAMVSRDIRQLAQLREIVLMQPKLDAGLLEWHRCAGILACCFSSIDEAKSHVNGLLEIATSHSDRQRRENASAAAFDLISVLSAIASLDIVDPLSQTLLPIRRDLYGDEADETIAIRELLADSLRARLKYAEAESEYRQIVGWRERVSGREHSKTLAALASLAGILSAQTKYAESEEVYRRVIESRKESSAPKIPPRCYIERF